MKATVFVPGKLGNDAKVTALNNGNSVITFSVATNQNYKDKDGENQQSTQWHECKRFVKKVNEKFVEKLKKGTVVFIKGSLMYDSWEKSVGGEEIKMNTAYIDIDEIDIN